MTTIEMANELAYALRKEAAGETLTSEPHVCAGIVPEQSVFIAESIQGGKFRVTVTAEAA